MTHLHSQRFVLPTPLSDSAVAFSQHGVENFAPLFPPQVAVITDFTGTISDDEQLYRNTWRQITLENGNAVHIEGQGFWLPPQDGFDWAMTKEDVVRQRGAIPIIEWSQNWDDPRTKWYGGGNKVVFDDLKRHGFLPAIETYERIEQIFRYGFANRIQAGELKLRVGMRDVLDHLGDHHPLTAMGTNDPRDLVNMKAKALGLMDANNNFHPPIQFAVTPEDVGGLTKPEPNIFLECLRRLQVQAATARTSVGPIVIFEDSFGGLEAAYAFKQALQATHPFPVYIVHYPFEEKTAPHPYADMTVHGGNAAKSIVGLLRRLSASVPALHTSPRP